MREHTVDTGRLRLSVRDHDGLAPAVVCLHGLASNARWWDLVAPRLAPRRVVAVDLRGHGLSDAPDDGYDFDSVAADVAALVEALGLGPVVVCGHSWGASVALAHAAAHPQAVCGVVCVDGGLADLRHVFGGSWADAEPLMTPPDLNGVTEEAVRGWAAAGPLSEGAGADEAARILMGNFAANGDGGLRPRLSRPHHMRIARALFELDTPTLLAAQTRPVLGVLARGLDGQGGRRRLAVEGVIAAAGEAVEVLWVEGGHDLPVQRPAEVAAAIAGFADRVAPLPA